MKLLLTNDDGIDAPGLHALEEALDEFGERTTIAPHEHLSGCSHQVTTIRPLLPQRVAPGRYSLDGTPADCVRLGLFHLAAGAEWVLSGINNGGNLGCDVYMSGTVAAVREAALHGKRGIAFSQYRRQSGAFLWTRSVAMVRAVLDVLLDEPLPPGAFWNVNLPDLDTDDVPEIVFCAVDHHPLPVRFEPDGDGYVYRGIYRERQRSPGRDVDVCFSGRIAVSQVLPVASAH
jgi:5'-nucleotidase